MIRQVLSIIFLIFAVAVYADSASGCSAAGCLDTQNPTLSLITPNSGEHWFIADAYDIQWYAGDTNLEPDCVALFYSLDSGLTFNPIASDLENDFNHVWEVSGPPSELALIKIQVHDSFGNRTEKQSSIPFHIKFKIPAPIGLVVQPLNQHTILSWEAVTQYPDGSLVTPDGYQVLFIVDPSSHPDDYTFLGSTTGTSFIHANAINTYNKCFYIVQAYLDDPLNGPFVSGEDATNEN